MPDLLHRCINNQDPAGQYDQAMDVEYTIYKAIVKLKDGLLKLTDD